MKNLLPALLLVFMNLVPCILFQQKAGKTFPVTFIITGLLMMLSRFIFGTFKAAYYIYYVTAIAGIALAIFYKDRKKNLQLILSIGFIAYCFIVFFLIWADTNHVLSVWDELQHWGKMVKEMIRIDERDSIGFAEIGTKLGKNLVKTDANRYRHIEQPVDIQSNLIGQLHASNHVHAAR